MTDLVVVFVLFIFMLVLLCFLLLPFLGQQNIFIYKCPFPWEIWDPWILGLRRFYPSYRRDGSVVNWLACWTQAQKGLGSNRSRDAVG